MASGSRVVDSSGRRRNAPSGQPIVSDGVTTDPCGCCGCADCAHCPDGVSASTALVTIAGLGLRSGCIDLGGGVWGSWAGGASFDGSYCVSCRYRFDDLASSNCNLGFTIVGPTLNLYSDSSCTTLIGTVSSWQIWLTPESVGGGVLSWSVRISGLLNTVSLGSYVVVNSPVFAFMAGDCLTAFTASPTTGNPLSDVGGSWSITPGGC